MARVELVTWNDVVEHLIDWMGANPTKEARRDAKRASLASLREVSNCHNWTFYYARGRVNTNAPYITGTVTYDHTGGSSERLITLSGGTFPSWAGQGVIEINSQVYEVFQRLSGTTLQLTIASNPGADITTGTAFTLFQDAYALPSNFQSMGEIIIATQARVLHPEHPSSWLNRQRIWRGSATPYSYTIMGSTDYQNTLAINFYPPPDNAYVIDYIYKRTPRPLKVDLVEDGKVDVSNGSATVTGTGTSFSSKLVGSVIRVSLSTTVAPTARWGSNPFEEERVITAVSSATSLAVDSVFTTSLAGVKYVISDPVDIDVNAMLTLLLRGSELETGHARNKRDRGELEQIYRRELIACREADRRNFKDESVGRSGVWPVRLQDFPYAGNG